MRVTWDEPQFEAGLDRGVMYFPGGGGVPWNGLVSVDEKTTSKVDPVHYDGVKFNDIAVGGDWQGTLKALTYPEELLEYEGLVQDSASGLYLGDQPPKQFGLSYRTMVGDAAGVSQDYKIHLLYNITAIPGTRQHRTMALNVRPQTFNWKLTAVPEVVDGYRSTAHVVIDSRKMDEWLMEDIEDILYGDENNPPRLPSLRGFVSFIQKWDRLIVVDNGDETWTAIASREGVIDFDPVDSDFFTINDANSTTIDANYYTLESSTRNEEDL